MKFPKGGYTKIPGAKRWAEKRFPNVTFDHGMWYFDLRILNNTLKRMEKIFEDHPILKEYNHFFTTETPIVEDTGNGKITLNCKPLGTKTYATCIDMEMVMATIKEPQTKYSTMLLLNPYFYYNYDNFSWIVEYSDRVGDSLCHIGSVIIHELGHILEFVYKSKLFEARCEPGFAEINKFLSDTDSNSKVIGKQLSRMAKEGELELWAEGFLCQYQSPPKNIGTAAATYIADQRVALERMNEILGFEPPKWGRISVQ
jgi:hypothetical protein